MSGREPGGLNRPIFFNAPARYLRWAAITHPAPFWSVIVGISAFPLAGLLFAYRRATGWEDAPHVPRTWPIPHRKREPLNDGGIYDDPK